MGSVGDESHGAVAEAAKELSEEPHLQKAEVREHASVELTEEHPLEKAVVREDASMELTEEPPLEKAEVREDASVELTEEHPLEKAEVREDASMELTKEPHLQKAEVREHAAVELTEEHPLEKAEVREDASVELTEEHPLEKAEVREDASMELTEEPPLEKAEVREDASVELTEEHPLEKAEVREDASMELTKEPHLQKAEVREHAAVELTEEHPLEKAEVREDASVELTEEHPLEKAEVREDASMELTEEHPLEKAEVCEDASVELTEEPPLEKAEVREDASVDAVTQQVSAVMGAGIDDRDKVDNGSVTTGEPEDMGNDAGVQEVAPAPKRKLPSVKRFSARRSAGLDDGNTMDYGSVTNGDAVPDSTAPSTIRRQRGAQRFSARMGIGIDDRDTVDYGSMTTDDPKPVETDAVVEEAVPTTTRKPLSVAEREQLRLQNIKRNKEIVCLERVRGKLVDITAGLELHTGVFSRVEQQKLVDLVRELQAKGRRNELKDRTYSEPRKWMRGKGRVTLQFGCCYNYAVDKNGNPPGILREDVVDPIPPLLRTTIKRLVRWHVLPPTCVPDSCIINMYEEGDCIPPHIDHHDFLRPFCTLSLLSECNIVFGGNLEILGPGDFGGKLSLPLPVGSVLVLNGNGADVAKHAVPAVPTERISITFRKMDPAKVPTGFTIDKELQNLRPVMLPSPQSPETEAEDS